MGNIYLFLIYFGFFAIKDGVKEPERITYPDSPNSEVKKTLVWSDEFNYAGLPDPNKWSYDTSGNATGWGNNEAEFYTKARLKNAEVKNGCLSINAIKEEYKGFHYTSSRLITTGKGDLLYGRM